MGRWRRRKRCCSGSWSMCRGRCSACSGTGAPAARPVLARAGVVAAVLVQLLLVLVLGLLVMVVLLGRAQHQQALVLARRMLLLVLMGPDQVAWAQVAVAQQGLVPVSSSSSSSSKEKGTARLQQMTRTATSTVRHQSYAGGVWRGLRLAAAAEAQQRDGRPGAHAPSVRPTHECHECVMIGLVKACEVEKRHVGDGTASHHGTVAKYCSH